MPRSLLAQLTQVEASAYYNDSVANPHTVGVAQAQTELEGDLNVVRSLLKDILGEAAWYTAPAWDIHNTVNKMFIYLDHESGFDNVSVSGTSTTAFDTAIKGITGHNNGGGNSTTVGVVVNGTKPYQIQLRDHTTRNPIDDGSGNDVYGLLTFSGGNYVVSFYSMKAGVQTAYTFAVSQAIDLSCILFSQIYKNLPWDQFLSGEFYDIASGTITDSMVSVSSMAYLYNGLTTEAQINAKGDKLGHADTAAEGAHLVKIDDTATGSNGYYTGTDVQTAFNETKTQIGGLTSTTYNFTNGTGSLLTDNDYIYPALDKLDQGFVKLMAINTAGQGANMVGVQDAALVFAATTVEGVLKELYDSIQDVVGWIKVSETVGPISAGTNHTVPNSNTYTMASGGLNMDIYYRGQLLLEGASNDYQEVSTTQIKFNFTVPANTNLTYMIRK
jgi:hypothetical protein